MVSWIKLKLQKSPDLVQINIRLTESLLKWLKEKWACPTLKVSNTSVSPVLYTKCLAYNQTLRHVQKQESKIHGNRERFKSSRMRNDSEMTQLNYQLGSLKVTLAKSKMLKKKKSSGGQHVRIHRQDFWNNCDENALKNLAENVDNIHEKWKSRNMVTKQI